MARSQQSFNKKENEKKKRKKKLDKEKRKEERHSNSDKGKSLDDMIAYVDEHGNISDTPPELSDKEEINVEDIQIGTPKKEDIEEEDTQREGTVSFFNDSKGYGFIRDHMTRESVFVHINELEQPIKEGNKVGFEIIKGPKGLNAVNVKLIS